MTSPVGLGGKLQMQPDLRASKRWMDPHGRVWWSTVEKASGAPVGGVYPSGWVAPLNPEWARRRCIPDQKYIHPTVNGAHDALLTIEYDQWLNDWDEADRERDIYMRDLINTSEVDAATLAEWSEKGPPKHIMNAVGKGPGEKIPRELIEAMAKGNKWALGLSDVMPEWAKSVVEKWEKLQRVTVARAQASTAYPDAPEMEPEPSFLDHSTDERFRDAEELPVTVPIPPHKGKAGKAGATGKQPVTVGSNFPR